MFRTGSSTKSSLNLPVRIQYAVLAGLCLFLASFYVFESSCRVLPDSWAKTTAYKAVIGGTERTKRVAVWRETRYLGGVAGVSECIARSVAYHSIMGECLSSQRHLLCYPAGIHASGYRIYHVCRANSGRQTYAGGRR